MLQNRNLSVNDKKRLLLLATREIERGDVDLKGTKNDGEQSTNKEKEQSYSGHRNLGFDYISPSVLHGFLLKYNQDNILKYTCHVIDDDEDIENINNACHTECYELEKHSELINKRFVNLLEDYQKEYPLILQSKMIPLMRAYITGKDYKGNPAQWSTLHIKTNWRLDELQQWGEKNPHMIPIPGKNIANKQRNNGFMLTERIASYLSGQPIRNLNGLVIYFKSLFHIRRDNSLKSILCYINKKIEESHKGKIHISLDNSKFPDNIELLTDVDKLLQGYTQILNICLSNQNKEFGNITEIELSFYEEDNHTFFCIHHKNTKYGKTVKNTIERIGKDQKKLIKNQMNGLCDLFVEADFGENNYYRINLWDDNSQMEVTQIDKIDGVKYLMRF